jgi:Uma2 family endonuclease
MASILDNPAVREVAVPVTVEQYHRMGEAGLIVQNTELLGGVIVEKMNKSPNHSWIVQYLADCLRSAVPHSMHMRQEQPLTLEDSEPEPDIAIVIGSRDDYRQAHPRSAELVIEVAVSSAAIDREKAKLYARAGVKEYLIVVPAEKTVEVYSAPTPNGYSHQQNATGTQLELATFPGTSVDLVPLFD